MKKWVLAGLCVSVTASAANHHEVDLRFNFKKVRSVLSSEKDGLKILVPREHAAPDAGVVQCKGGAECRVSGVEKSSDHYTVLIDFIRGNAACGCKIKITQPSGAMVTVSAKTEGLMDHHRPRQSLSSHVDPPSHHPADPIISHPPDPVAFHSGEVAGVQPVPAEPGDVNHPSHSGEVPAAEVHPGSPMNFLGTDGQHPSGGDLLTPPGSDALEAH